MQTSKWTRRRFLGSAAAVPLTMQMAARAAAPRPTPKWVFLGTDTGEGIYRARWDAATGKLGPIELAVKTPRPNFFVLHPHLPVLYTVNEIAEGPGAVSSFRLDHASGGLTPINSVDSQGTGPCALGIDREGTALFVADYSGGAFAAFPLGADGAIGAAAHTLHCQGNAACGPLGPVHDHQDAAHLHCAVVSLDNRFVLVCDLGDDAIQIFPLQPGSKEIVGTPQRVAVRPGSGPRHLVFHPSGRWFYCAHELDASLDLYDWKTAGGLASAVLRKGSVVSLLKPGTPLAGNSGCELQVSRNGRFLYACLRGANEITVYAVGAGTGTLREIQRLACGGKVPRYFALDPSERWLVCTNQAEGGATVAVFPRNPATGKLGTPAITPATTPMFVAWA